MQIELKSNRNFMVYMLLPMIICCFIIFVMTTVGICMGVGTQDTIIACAVSACTEAVLIVTVLVIRFYKGKRYIFNKEFIEVYDRDKLVEKILIEHIKSIEYIRYRFLLSIVAFFGGSTYTWSLDVKLNNGERFFFGFLSVKDVRRLKAELYGDLITIS